MISRRACVTTVLATGVLLVAVLASAQPKDPFVGTWRLNIVKSKYSPGPAPKSQTATYESRRSEAKDARRYTTHR